MTIFPYFCHPIILLNMAFFSLCLVTNSYLLVSLSLLARLINPGPDTHCLLLQQTSQSLTYLIVYPFSIGESGLTFIAPLIGTWLAMLFCGLLADRLYMRWAKREGGRPKPEHRLPLLVVTGVMGVGGLLLFGICTQEKCHWVGPLFGSAFGEFGA
jgi:MFS family permease